MMHLLVAVPSSLKLNVQNACNITALNRGRAFAKYLEIQTDWQLNSFLYVLKIRLFLLRIKSLLSTATLCLFILANQI